MASRLELQNLLEEIIESEEVYFQPPASIKMNYPAIVYNRETINNIHANDGVYGQFHGYNLTVIYEDPDSELPIKISKLPNCRHNRHYVSDNLNHDVFTIY